MFPRRGQAEERRYTALEVQERPGAPTSGAIPDVQRGAQEGRSGPRVPAGHAPPPPERERVERRDRSLAEAPAAQPLG